MRETSMSDERRKGEAYSPAWRKLEKDYKALQAELDRIRPAAQAVVERHRKTIITGTLSYKEFESEALENLAAAIKGDKHE
jgi:hypothetical protein